MQLEPCNYNNYSTLKIINTIYTTMHMQYLCKALYGYKQNMDSIILRTFLTKCASVH